MAKRGLSFAYSRNEYLFEMSDLEVRLTRLAVGMRNEKSRARKSSASPSPRRWFVVALSVLLSGFSFSMFSSLAAHCQETAKATTAQPENTSKAADTTSTVVTMQLNKLEDVKGSCRVYFVLANKTQKNIKTFKIDLILFRTDGVIGKRVFADMAPLRSGSKQQVKLFDLSGIKCSEVGSLLVNDALECRNEDGVINQCYSRLAVSHIGKVSLSK